MAVHGGRRPLAFLMLPFLGACSRCDHKPYVPYTIEEAGAADAAAPSVPTDAGAQRRAAQLAPPNSARWRLGDNEWEAPSEHVFVSAVEGDFDADGVRDLVAFVRPSLRPREISLALLKKGVPATVFPFRGIEACEAEPRKERLETLGAKELLVEVPEGCDGRLRQLLVLTVQANGFGIRFRAAIEDPKGLSPTTTIASSEDLDGDGVLDLTVALADATSPAVSVPLRFLDRPTGLSQDAGEPNATVTKWIAELRAKGGAKGAPEVWQRAASFRDLLVGVCETKQRLRLSDGRACPPIPALTELLETEGKLRFLNGDVATGAYLLSVFAERTSDAKKLDGLAKSLRANLPTIADGTIREASAKPLRLEGGAHASPLDFNQAGLLEVMTAEGVVQINLTTNEEVRVGSPVWNTALVSPSQTRRLLDGRCESRGTFGKIVNAAAIVDEVEIALRPTGCAVPRPVQIQPIASTDEAALLSVDGELLTLTADYSARRAPIDRAKWKHVRGASSSPLGRFSVAAVRTLGGRLSGLLVSGAKTRLLQAREIEDVSALRDCVVNDAGDAVACVRNERVVLGTWRVP